MGGIGFGILAYIITDKCSSSIVTKHHTHTGFIR